MSEMVGMERLIQEGMQDGQMTESYNHDGDFEV